MPDRRGSAAKAELVVRAVGYATGMELPAFREGIVPDLEAYMNSQEDFVAQYPSMFTQAPRQC
jgi:avirulence protein